MQYKKEKCSFNPKNIKNRDLLNPKIKFVLTVVEKLTYKVSNLLLRIQQLSLNFRIYCYCRATN